MKIGKISSLIFICCGLFIYCNKNTAIDRACEISKPTDSYNNYPSRTNPSWGSLSPDEQLKACQIPAATLKSMSTEGVIQSWLDFPLAYRIFLNNSILGGLDFYIVNFSGLIELFTRTDAETKMLEWYKKMNTDCSKSSTSPGDFTLQYSYLELVLAQDFLISQLPDQKKIELVAESISKYKSKILNSDFGTASQLNCLLISARTMNNLKYQPFILEVDTTSYLKIFLKTELIPSDTIIRNKLFQTILNHSAALK